MLKTALMIMSIAPKLTHKYTPVRLSSSIPESVYQKLKEKEQNLKDGITRILSGKCCKGKTLTSDCCFARHKCADQSMQEIIKNPIVAARTILLFDHMKHLAEKEARRRSITLESATDRFFKGTCCLDVKKKLTKDSISSCSCNEMKLLKNHIDDLL